MLGLSFPHGEEKVEVFARPTTCDVSPMSESHPQNPTNPGGAENREGVIERYDRNKDRHVAALRHGLVHVASSCVMAVVPFLSSYL